MSRVEVLSSSATREFGSQPVAPTVSRTWIPDSPLHDPAKARSLGLISDQCGRCWSGRAHLLLDPLHSSSPQPECPGYLQDPYPLLELLLCFAFKADIDLRSSQPCTLCDSTFKPRLD